MKKSKVPGVYYQNNKIFTESSSIKKGSKVYNEKLINHKEKELRSWNPYRSKLASAIINGFELKIKIDSKILYLGAATGTTVSHLSDIAQNGIIYAVENSAVAVKKLIELCETRKNIIPIFADANHPESYNTIVLNTDLIYQDISQRNQAEIFSLNISKFLKKEGYGILMVKARSIDVSLKPEEAYDKVCVKLEKKGLNVLEKINLNTYVKDHIAIIISNK